MMFLAVGQSLWLHFVRCDRRSSSLGPSRLTRCVRDAYASDQRSEEDAWSIISLTMMEMTKLLLLCSGIVAGVVLLVVLFAFDSLRRFCDRRFGCGGWGIAELDAERAIQAQVDEAVEGKTKEQVQLERREWYERYLKPFTRVSDWDAILGRMIVTDVLTHHSLHRPSLNRISRARTWRATRKKAELASPLTRSMTLNPSVRSASRPTKRATPWWYRKTVGTHSAKPVSWNG